LGRRTTAAKDQAAGLKPLDILHIHCPALKGGAKHIPSLPGFSPLKVAAWLRFVIGQKDKTTVKIGAKANGSDRSGDGAKAP